MNKVSITINSPIPPDEEVAEALGKHLLDLARKCEEVGWEASIHLTMTKDQPGD